MAKLFKLSVIAPDEIIYEGEIVSLVVPAALGYLGVLADHAPLIANLVSGKIAIREESGKNVNFYYQGKGFLEVFKNNVNVILNHAIAAKMNP